MVEEVPEEIQVIDVVTEGGEKKKKVINKRVIKKQIGGKREKTEIVTVEEEGKAPETTVSVEELESSDEVAPEKPIYIAQELPEEVEVTEVVTEGGKERKKVVRKRVIKKEVGGKQEKTEIVTVEEEDQLPKTTVKVEIEEKVGKPKTEFEKVLFVPTLAEKEKHKPDDVLELVQLEVLKKALQQPQGSVENETPEESDYIPSKDKKAKKRVTKKTKDLKQKKAQVFMTDDENEEKPELFEVPTYIEELPIETFVTETITKGGKPRKRIVKTRVIVKRRGSKQEKTKIMEVKEDDKEPETTVTIEESLVPEEIKSESQTYILELPEEKRKGNKKEITEILTVQEEDKKPQTTVTVNETDIPLETFELIPEQQPSPIEELPEEIITEILTTSVKEEGLKPQTTVTVEETDLPKELAEGPDLPAYVVDELPEQVVTEIVTMDGKPKKDNYKKESD
ncbi:hypothetical protein NQ318_016820 [Aromia moschata]|uniref:Titin-like n=1 Tax=Aromia moschata TaxID=1265417 RepID=A0AAV8YW13_9CUCU|nr:hypothetical protein NQ318_016820 [Aromia moschata]